MKESDFLQQLTPGTLVQLQSCYNYHDNSNQSRLYPYPFLADHDQVMLVWEIKNYVDRYGGVLPHLHNELALVLEQFEHTFHKMSQGSSPLKSTLAIRLLLAKPKPTTVVYFPEKSSHQHLSQMFKIIRAAP